VSINAINLVWKHSRARGAGLCIMLAIADWVNDQHGYAWPSIDAIAAKARVSVRTVQREIDELQALGELAVHYNSGRNGVNRYYVTIDVQDSGPLAPQGWGVTSDAETPDSGVTSCRKNVTQSLSNPYQNKRTKTNTAARSQSSRAGVGTNAKPPRGKTWGDGCPEFPVDRRIDRIASAGTPRPKVPKHEPPQDPLMHSKGKKPPGSAAPPKAGLFGVEEPKVPADEIVVRDAFQLAYENRYGVLAKWSGAESRQAKDLMREVRNAAEKRRAKPEDVLARVCVMSLNDTDPFLEKNAHRFLLLTQRAPGYLSEVLKLGNKRSNPADTDGVMW
jgi:hypothetical protein